MITLGVFLASTAMTALSFAPWWFFLFRFLTGFGIGGEYAAINSAIDELIPSRNRGMIDIVINGTAYPLLTSDYTVQSQGKGKKTAGKILGGAGLGALIGGIAGGGTGAAIGVAAGAAGGTALSAAGKGQQVSIPSESLLEFRLQQPASLPVAR